MGAINNAFNQAAGAAAGAALAIKHAKETDFSKAITAENAAHVARNQARAAEAEAKDTKTEEWQAGDDYINAMIDKIDKTNKYEKAKNRKNASDKTVYKKYKDLQAAEKALGEVSNKIDSIQAMQQRATEQRAHADKATQLAEKAQQKYQSRWGGR